MKQVNEHKRHSVVYNVVMNAIVMTSAFIFPLITVPYLSRVLLEYGNGIVSFAQNFVYYFSTIASMGVANYGVVACSRVRDDKEKFSKTSIEILIVLFSVSLLMTLIYLLLVLLLPRFSDARVLYVFMATSIWTTAFAIEWFYQSIEQYDYITFRALIVRIVGTICIFVFVKTQDDYFVYAVITVLTQGASSLINLARMRKLIDFSSVKKINPFKHVKPMLAYLLMNVGKGMANKSDILVLGFIGSVELVGVYQIASKVENMVVAAVDSVGSVLLPRLTSYKANAESNRYLELFSQGINFAILMGCASIGGIMLCAEPIIGILGGQAYMGAVLPLITSAPAVLFAACTSVISQSLFINDGERKFAFANIVGLIVAIAAGLGLYPLFNIAGTGLAVSLSQFSVFVITVMFSRSVISDVLSKTDWPKIIISAFIAFVIGSLVSSQVGSFDYICKLFLVGFSFLAAFAVSLLLFHESLATSLVQRYIHKS